MLCASNTNLCLAALRSPASETHMIGAGAYLCFLVKPKRPKVSNVNEARMFYLLSALSQSRFNAGKVKSLICMVSSFSIILKIEADVGPKKATRYNNNVKNGI